MRAELAALATLALASVSEALTASRRPFKHSPALQRASNSDDTGVTASVTIPFAAPSSAPTVSRTLVGFSIEGTLSNWFYCGARTPSPAAQKKKKKEE